MPADQAEAVQKNLDKLGDVDQFLVDELGYNDKDDMYLSLIHISPPTESVLRHLPMPYVTLATS